MTCSVCWPACVHHALARPDSQFLCCTCLSYTFCVISSGLRFSHILMSHVHATGSTLYTCTHSGSPYNVIHSSSYTTFAQTLSHPPCHTWVTWQSHFYPPPLTSATNLFLKTSAISCFAEEGKFSGDGCGLLSVTSWGTCRSSKFCHTYYTLWDVARHIYMCVCVEYACVICEKYA